MDRVTYITVFDLYLINEFIDHIFIGSFFILWLVSSIQSNKVRFLIGVFAALFVGTALTNYTPVLNGIALSALPVIVSLIIYNWYSRSNAVNSARSNLTLNYISIIGIVVGLISLALTLSSITMSGERPNIRDYAHEIFLLFSSLSPVLMLILITSFLIKVLINSIPAMRKRTIQSITHEYNLKGISTTARVCYLSIFIFLSVIMVIIPHLPTVNKDNQLIGVDTPDYVIWMNDLKNSQDAQNFLDKVFIIHNNGDRPFSLILIYSYQAIVAQDSNMGVMIEYLPLVLGPTLVLVIYFLTREITSNEVSSLLAAFITALSYHVLVGIYAGFYANWISLIFGYLSFIFLFRFLKRQGIINLVLYGIFLTLTLFSHNYTWSIVALVMGIFLTVHTLKRGLYRDNRCNPQVTRKNAIVLLVVLFCTVGIDIGKTFLTGSLGGIERDLQLSETKVGVDQFLLRWNNLTYGTTVYVGGLFANFIILGLGLYWLIGSQLNAKYDIFIIIFLSIGILPFLFGDWVIQTRIFYNIPFQIPVAIALSKMFQPASVTISKVGSIFVWLIAMQVLAVTNFYLILS